MGSRVFHSLKQFLITALVAGCFAGLSREVAHAGAKGELVMNSQLTRELNQVLKMSNAVHQALVANDEEQTDLGLRDLLKQIDRARAVSHLAKPHERSHLLIILDAAREQFELTQAAYGNERRHRLEEGFNQLVNLVRIYKLDKTYAIYFCPKDKATWVQTGMKAQNPFQSSGGGREPCGIRVQK
jgi:hypothetical protein